MQITSDLTELKEVIGYDWHEKLDTISNKPYYQSYLIEVDHFLLNYIKTYKIVKSKNRHYVEIDLSSKYISNKLTKHKQLKHKKIDLATEEWNRFDQIIQQTCFWTQRTNVERDTTSNDYLAYVIEGIDTNENPCTKNAFHRIIRYSRTDPDIQELIDQIARIEPMNDLDSLNNMTFKY